MAVTSFGLSFDRPRAVRCSSRWCLQRICSLVVAVYVAGLRVSFSQAHHGVQIPVAAASLEYLCKVTEASIPLNPLQPLETLQCVPPRGQCQKGKNDSDTHHQSDERWIKTMLDRDNGPTDLRPHSGLE
jgi:hypothetical protein